MDNYQTRINELKSRIDDNNIDLKLIYQSAGERAAFPDVCSGKNDSVKISLEKLSNLETDLKKMDIQIDDLRNSFSRIADITDREKEIGEEYSTLERENRKLLLPIGKAVYVNWKDNPSNDFPRMMKNLNEQESKIIAIDNDIYKLNSNMVKKNIISLLHNKSRIFLLNSKRKSFLSVMDTLYKKTGEKVIKKDLSYFDTLKNESIYSFISNRKAIEVLDSEIGTLKEETLRLEKHLKSQFRSSKQNKAEEKLQSERDFILSAKMAALNELGALLYSEKIDFGDLEIKNLLKSAAEINGKNEQLIEEIDVCKANLEIENLDSEVLEMKKNIKDLEMTIEKSTGDIAEFNKEIKRARAEIRKLKKMTEPSAEIEDN